MPVLSCSAKTCVYNKEELCCKGDIMVEGSGARTADQTCCASVKARSRDSMSNSAGSAKAQNKVDCQACDCTFNKDRCCDAHEIHISGSHACQCSETECGSFRCKDR